MKIKHTIVLVAVITSYTSLNLSAQSPTVVSQKSVVEKFTTLYNHQKFDSIYQMVNGDVQKATTQAAFTSFLSSNLYSNYGQLKRTSYLSGNSPMVTYLAEFERGFIDMELVIDSNKLIAGIQFLPHKSVNKDTAGWKPLITNNPRSSKLDQYVDSLVQASSKGTYRVGLNIGVIDSKGEHVYGYGETKKGNDTIPDRETIFEIASVSKTFTAWLFSEAIEKKLVNENDDVRKYLKGNYPNLEFNGKYISLKDLANHTAGLPRVPSDLDKQVDYNVDDPYKNYSRQMLLDNLKQVKLEKEPGVVSEYSNYGMALLGIIMEDVFKKNYEELLAEYITKPLGMNSTYVNVPVIKEKQEATAYKEDGNETSWWHLNDMAACGGINSTMNDMLAYVKANYEEKTPVIRRVHEPTVKISDNRSITYGWQILKMKDGSNMIWHNGGTYGSSSYCGFIPSRKLMIVILSNSDINCDSIAISIMNKLISEK